MTSPQVPPNPETPLAFLPPTLAGQLELSHYFTAGTCGMFVWDILINTRNDYRLLTKYRVAFPTVIYFLSRIASFAFIITAAAFIGPIGSCQALQVTIGSCFAAAVSLTSLLFFFRVRAIFYNNKWIVAFFSLLWLSTVAGSITVPFAITGSHIGPTDHCINTGVKPYSSAGIILVAANDTLVFFAISWKLLSSSAVDESFKAKVKVFISGNGLPVITRSLLQSGQEYYLITVAANILTMAMILAPSPPAVFRAMFTVPNVAIGNAMACRVYRDIKLGRISSTHTIIPVCSATQMFPPSPALRNNMRVPRDSYGTEIELNSNHDADPPMTITLPPDNPV